LNLGHFGVKLHRSVDCGVSWEEVGAPVYPEKPGDSCDEVPWSLDQIWALERAGARLWAGTLPGGLFSSVDGGRSWELNQALWDRPERSEWFGGGYDHPGIHSICVDPRDPRCLTVGVSCGGVWQTNDEGESWELLGEGLRADYMPPERAGDRQIQDPHRLVQCGAHPDRFWIQHHNGIFRSDDGSRTWAAAEAAPDAFGFAVAVHPRDPDVAWFVPGIKDECRIPAHGRFIVRRTRDGGKTFEDLSRGLPDEPAYDLVFRHCLEVDRTGETLLMGSTTGTVWLSQDQGDSWEVISHHLPPVYVVRFI